MSERVLALASGVHDGNPPIVSPADMVRIAADAGYNSVGLWVAPGENWHAPTSAEVGSALRETGLIPLDVEVIWIQPGGKPDPIHHKIIEIGGEIGARNCLIVSSEPDRELTKNLYEDLCEHAQRAGMRACLEYMAITEVKTLDDALEIVTAVDHPAGVFWWILSIMSESGMLPKKYGIFPSAGCHTHSSVTCPIAESSVIPMTILSMRSMAGWHQEKAVSPSLQ